jgi:hypothetical protein
MNRSSFSMVSLLLVLSAVFLFSSRLEAQFTCTGSICGYFPGGITNDLNGTLGRIEREYLQEVLKNNTETAFINQIVSNSVGTGSVSHFQLGVSAGAAGIKKDDIIIQNEKIKLPNLPNAGVSLQPNINFDFNLGWILGFSNDSFVRRFSIYLHGMDVQISEGDAKGLSSAKENLRFQGKVKSIGGMLRFQAVKPIPFGFSLFSWTGINIGGGYHFSKQDYTLVSQNEQAQKMELNGISGKWGGDTTLIYQTETKTYNLDVRTGLGMFWILTIYAGGGYTWNSGSSFVNLNRTGPFVLQANGLQDVNIPREYQSYFNQDKTIQQAGTLGLNTSARGGSRRSIAYAIGGIELDLILLKATLEAIYGNKDLFGGSIAFRFSF